MKVWGLDVNVPMNFDKLMADEVTESFKKNNTLGINERSDKMSQIVVFKTKEDCKNCQKDLEELGIFFTSIITGEL